MLPKPAKNTWIAIAWFAMGMAAVIIQLLKGNGSINNYLIYEGVFHHSVAKLDLFSTYPTEYFDANHYGPVFALIIAPFALLPVQIGAFLWGAANVWLLYFAVKRLPIPPHEQNLVLLICAVELMTAMHNMQFNPMLTAFIILGYTFVYKGQDIWGTLFIALGILTKLYGIVGLAFFFFSADKPKFILYTIMWMAVFLVAPVILSSADYVMEQYRSWYNSLVVKNSENTGSTMQDMSALRILRTLLGIAGHNIIVLGFAAIMYIVTLLRFHQWQSQLYQLNYLAFLLIGIVIFSSSAESPTYIIAMCGVAIWYVIQLPRNYFSLIVVMFAFILTSLSTTDVFPAGIKINVIRPYGLKALPCLMVWVILCFQLLTREFRKPLTAS